MSEPRDADASLTFDWTKRESPSAAVVAAVAEQVDTDSVAIEPLYETIDPDALDSIFAPTDGSRRTAFCSVEFEYVDYRIVLNADGQGFISARNEGQSLNADTPESTSSTGGD